ncbi:Sugar phosphate isomerase/epimerase [Goodfellowiella coeruleoviolacea]|uniref:Sugar phosphate isomerase/epimerase n=1 Tax=Goodfellowiella coeruleoviolacea TaxID=334858 RepID=A0AAE3GG98_9PSEU|nr:Sugar phosphate isomerase/epimerase [Goodfellowiella coeruleoviolacea]
MDVSGAGAREIGLDHLTLVDVSPPELVAVADAVGFDSVGLRVHPARAGEQRWPVRTGSPMLLDTTARLRDSRVRVHSVEVLPLAAHTRVADCESVLATGARLGARFVGTFAEDPDTDRLADTFAALTERARDYGLRALLEPMTQSSVSTVGHAQRVVARSAGGGVLLDALHLVRGGSWAAGHVLDRALVGYVQLSDGRLDGPGELDVRLPLPRRQPIPSTEVGVESVAARLLPGEGELPLAELLAAVPADTLVSVEAPAVRRVALVGAVNYARWARRAVDAVLTAPARTWDRSRT